MTTTRCARIFRPDPFHHRLESPRSTLPDFPRVPRVPQSREYVTVGSDRLAPFPEAPKTLTAIDAAILKALEDAAQTVGSDSTRFALTRVQLRGKTGEIV